MKPEKSIDSIYDYTSTLIDTSADIHALAISFRDTGNTFVADKLIDMSDDIIASIEHIKRIHDKNLRDRHDDAVSNYFNLLEALMTKDKNK